MARTIWDDFNAADEHSTFFDKENHKVQRQYVVRWSNTLRSKAAAEPDKKDLFEDTQRMPSFHLI